MIERQIWHPVIDSAGVRESPVAAELLGQALVLWREPGHDGAPGVVHAWDDRCPHRGAKLSLGRVLHHVRGARLECPYHGWQYAGDAAALQTATECGRCLHVPAAPAFTPTAAHRATAFEAVERYGLVWVRLQLSDHTLVPAELDLPPPFEPWDDPGWRQLLCGPYEVATSAARLIENFLDLSHFGFVHEGWLGERSHAQVETGQVEELPTGLVARECRAWQPRGYAEAPEGGWVSYRYDVLHPFAAILRKDAAEGDSLSNAIALFIRPDSDESCTAWFSVATLGDMSDDETLSAFQDTVFSQDRPVIESQTPKRLPIGIEGVITEVNGPADRMSAAYRRYLKRLRISLGVC